MRKVKIEVKEILLNNPETRGDDMALFYSYVLSKGGISLDAVFTNPKYRKEHDIATFECVSRMRRKLQEENPMLLPNKACVVGRRKAEKRYHEYYQLSLF